MTISSLSFTPTIVDSGKFLTCRVGSSPHIVEDGWKLNIHRKYTVLDISLNRTGDLFLTSFNKMHGVTLIKTVNNYRFPKILCIYSNLKNKPKVNKIEYVKIIFKSYLILKCRITILFCLNKS